MKKSKDKKIFIDNDYAFEIDSRCITLFKKRITQKGQLQYDTVGYYTSLEAAYNRLIDTELEGCRNLQDIADRQIELRNYIKDSLKTISERAHKHGIDFLMPAKLAIKKAPRKALN